MEIKTTTLPVISPVSKSQNVSFASKAASKSLSEDKFFSDNIDYESFKNGINTIVFKKPVPVTQALWDIMITLNEDIKTMMKAKFHPIDDLQEMFVNLFQFKELKDVKVKQLCGMGHYALAFETTDGDILKITNKKHFPNNRKPAFFDLPIKKSGGSNDTYFYLEEKVDSENITNVEMNNLLMKIQEEGYITQDFLTTVEEEGAEYKIFRKEQFGKTKDGTVYIVDPGCVKEPDTLSFKFKHHFIDKLKKLF